MTAQSSIYIHLNLNTSFNSNHSQRGELTFNSQSSSVVSSSITSKETFNVILPLRDAFWTSANQLRKISKLHRWHSEGCRRCSHWWISILHTSEKIQNHDLYPNLPQRFPYYLEPVDTVEALETDQSIIADLGRPNMAQQWSKASICHVPGTIFASLRRAHQRVQPL